MKKLLFCSLIILSFGRTFGQLIVNDVSINDQKDIQYISVEPVPKGLLTYKIYVSIDFGQPMNLREENLLTDLDKQPRIFNSTMDALNFLYKNSWELISVSAIAEAEPKDSINYRYLLKRKPEPK